MDNTEYYSFIASVVAIYKQERKSNVKQMRNSPLVNPPSHFICN